MSGHSYGKDCPKCGKNMECDTDTRASVENSYYGDCWNCGYYERVEIINYQRTAKELIDERIDCEVEIDQWEEYCDDKVAANEEYLSFQEWTKQRVTTEKL